MLAYACAQALFFREEINDFHVHFLNAGVECYKWRNSNCAVVSGFAQSSHAVDDWRLRVSICCWMVRVTVNYTLMTDRFCEARRPPVYAQLLLLFGLFADGCWVRPTAVLIPGKPSVRWNIVPHQCCAAATICAVFVRCYSQEIGNTFL